MARLVSEEKAAGTLALLNIIVGLTEVIINKPVIVFFALE